MNITPPWNISLLWCQNISLLMMRCTKYLFDGLISISPASWFFDRGRDYVPMRGRLFSADIFWCRFFIILTLFSVMMIDVNISFIFTLRYALLFRYYQRCAPIIFAAKYADELITPCSWFSFRLIIFSSMYYFIIFVMCEGQLMTFSMLIFRKHYSPIFFFQPMTFSIFRCISADYAAARM